MTSDLADRERRFTRRSAQREGGGPGFPSPKNVRNVGGEATLVQMMCSQLCWWLLAAIAVTPPAPPWQEASRFPPDWPCGAKLDTSYFAVAEATGGQMLLTPPDELLNSAAPLAAAWDHRQTLFRYLGPIDAGGHEFRVPVDPSVESIMFSMFVQCLKTADLQPPVEGHGGEMSESKSRAWRVFIVKRPQAGVWTMRVSGSGLLGVTVHARSTLEIAQVQFGLAGSTTLDQSPRRGVENIVRIDMSRGTTQVEASIVDATFRKVAALPRAPNSTDGTYFSGFTPGAAPFRIMVEGKGADGVAFQRVHGPLFTPE